MVDKYIIRLKIYNANKGFKKLIRLPSMQTRRIQNMLFTINNCISGKAPHASRDLVTLRSSMTISFLCRKITRLNMVSNYGEILTQRNGTS